MECNTIQRPASDIPVLGSYDVVAIRGKAFVDATGDADLATRCGCAYIQGDELNGDIAGVSLMLQLEKVDEQRFMEAMIAEDDPRQRKRLAVLRENGEFPFPIPLFVFVKLNAEGLFMVNGNWMPAEDATDPFWRSKTILELRGRLPQLLHCFHTHFPGLEACELRAFATNLGVRETRRIDSHGHGPGGRRCRRTGRPNKQGIRRDRYCRTAEDTAKPRCHPGNGMTASSTEQDRP